MLDRLLEDPGRREPSSGRWPAGSRWRRCGRSPPASTATGTGCPSAPRRPSPRRSTATTSSAPSGTPSAWPASAATRATASWPTSRGLAPWADRLADCGDEVELLGVLAGLGGRVATDPRPAGGLARPEAGGGRAPVRGPRRRGSRRSPPPRPTPCGRSGTPWAAWSARRRPSGGGRVASTSTTSWSSPATSCATIRRRRPRCTSSTGTSWSTSSRTPTPCRRTSPCGWPRRGPPGVGGGGRTSRWAPAASSSWGTPSSRSTGSAVRTSGSSARRRRSWWTSRCCSRATSGRRPGSWPGWTPSSRGSPRRAGRPTSPWRRCAGPTAPAPCRRWP